MALETLDFAPSLDIGIRHPNALRLFGPPGSGKTRELVRLLGEHVAEGDFALTEAIIVSFTNAAAKDIARRVNPGGATGRYHCTIHALCRRYLDLDTSRICEKYVHEFFQEQGIAYKRGHRSEDPDSLADLEMASEEGNQLMLFFNWARNKLTDVTSAKKMFTPHPTLQHWWSDDRLEKLWARYVAWKSAREFFDFTDMLEEAVHYGAGMKTPCLVVDEMQDSTPLQIQALAGFVERAEVCYFAGDDDQAIYGFLGADAREFLEAKTPWNRTLHLNHRSGSQIVEHANKLIRRNENRHEKGMVAIREGGSIQVAQTLPTMYRDRSTMLIARANSGLSQFRTQLTKTATPFYDMKRKAGINGAGGPAYERLHRFMNGQAATVDDWRLTMEIIPSEPWLTRGAKTRIKTLCQDSQQAQRIIRGGDLLNYGATDELLQAMASGSFDFVHDKLAPALAYLKAVERDWGAEFLEPGRAHDVCVLGTIHSQKGREADRVLLVNSVPMAVYQNCLVNPEEERRIKYVAQTRARDELIYLQVEGGMPWPL